MKHKIVAVGLIVVLSILHFGPSTILGQDSSQPWFGTWQAVKAIPPGDKLELKLKSGKTVKGTLSSVSDTGISLAPGSDSASINRDDVRRVYRIIGKSSRKPVLIGALVGAAIGAGGTVNYARTGEVTTNAALLPLVGAGIGALIGLAFGGRDKRILIYEIQ